VRGGSWRAIEFPSLCALIEHPAHGHVLYDTGYAPHFFAATNLFPERLYRMILPVELRPEENLAEQLARLGVEPARIATVLISHFHGDHVAGLKDFPASRFLAMRADVELLLSSSRLRALRKAMLPDLLPSDFAARCDFADDRPRIALPPWMRPFTTGFDLLGDRSLIGIALPGHTPAQLGLLLCDPQGRRYFLVGDACWSLPACRAGKLPAPLVVRHLSHDPAAYERTFFAIRELALREPELTIVPSHCALTWNSLHGAAA
jgi:glyoxylase-like metal-dependent hydrolase (beta-lactamase superfamily II)